ncbi:hypothetical protein [Haloarcula salina]|uniref:Uncharacterized protein n=1 Tax=Haloarcula salina TaxID=1429914 RepID=A0AA41GA57_9EURY|nr:hypothetical protein [Haloarcula salina]MBV0902977.1 hypothetical protein [Haloarcula salina]
MAVHSAQGDAGRAGGLPDVVPFELSYLSRLSWELGTRIVDDDESTALGTWTHADRRWEVSVHEVTSETALIRTRSPVGREQFYGAICTELRAAIESFETMPSWQQRGK